MIDQAIILAGGLGTRLRSAVPDLPKCMAPVAGKPFLAHVINYFQKQGVRSFVFALGYKSEVIIDYIASSHPGLQANWSIEQELLGTGGAIKLACAKATSENVVILNGDTIFKIDLPALSAMHQQSRADCTLTLKPMTNFDRYGVVEVERDGRIASFREKQFYESGLINGGVYALNLSSFMKESFPEKFSFEKDYLEAKFTDRPMFAQVQDEYFIDIGIPVDYEKAQKDF
jgi:D-glycero-alpha-D-manno-heptose 1-phosphate guanylyltransferase